MLGGIDDKDNEVAMNFVVPDAGALIEERCGQGLARK
jgi:hypothetical protein